MELILAGQSVHIKCRIQASIMMGNYEFYYAAGWLCALAGRSLFQAPPPRELYSFLQPLFDTYKPGNEQEAYLVKMLKEYRVSDEYDEQMTELFEMGFAEKNLDNS
ncbi:MAG: DUF3837 domain-containing protein [Eubacterium sp.]|nr:DUF3837 domain-containing protein [Eubacterium sp.]